MSNAELLEVVKSLAEEADADRIARREFNPFGLVGAYGEALRNIQAKCEALAAQLNGTEDAWFDAQAARYEEAQWARLDAVSAGWGHD